MSLQRKPALGFIFITLLIDVIGIGIIIPVIPKLITQVIHGNLSQASLYSGWLMFSFAIMQFIFSPILGSLSDKYGRRPILLLALVGFGIDNIILAFAPTITWLFIARIIAGIMGASFTTASAYIADISTAENRAQNFGMIGVAFGVGFIIGPVLGGLLGHIGVRIPFFAAAALALLNALYGYFILPESLPKENRRKFDIKRANPLGALKQLKKYPFLSGLIGSLIFLYIAGHAVQSNWTFYTMEVLKWNESQVGFSLGIVGLMVAIVQGGLIRYINPYLGQKRSIYVGLGLEVLGLALLAFSTQNWTIYAFLIPYCLGGIAGPALQAIISEQVPSNEQGELQGSLTSLMSLTSIIGPLLMTNIFSYFTGRLAPFYFPGSSFLLGSILTLISLLLVIKPLKKHMNI
jgi:DHA1 family tetracycline resistance protein-like MFS transporter